MKKLRMMLVGVVLALGCNTPSTPSSVDKVTDKASAVPKESCACKSNSCLCSHCGTSKGPCVCKK